MRSVTEVLGDGNREHGTRYGVGDERNTPLQIALGQEPDAVGADAAARLFTAAVAPGVERSDVGGRLVDAVAEAARRDGARFLVAELPDDPAIGAVLALLREHGFREEARVVDYFRDGVALSVLRLAL